MTENMRFCEIYQFFFLKDTSIFGLSCIYLQLNYGEDHPFAVSRADTNEGFPWPLLQIPLIVISE